MRVLIIEALRRKFSFVLDHRTARPADWARDTPLLEVHDSSAGALSSPRLPAELPAEFLHWRRQHPDGIPGDRTHGFRRHDKHKKVEVPTRPPGYYQPRQIWNGAGLTADVMRSVIGTAILVRRSGSDLGDPTLSTPVAVRNKGGSVQVDFHAVDAGSESRYALDLAQLDWVATVDNVGHPPPAAPVSTRPTHDQPATPPADNVRPSIRPNTSPRRADRCPDRLAATTAYAPSAALRSTQNKLPSGSAIVTQPVPSGLR